jgi:serine O-acetyltransferase
MDRNDLNRQLPGVIDRLVKSIVDLPSLQHLNRVHLPSRDVTIDVVKKLRELMFPGFFGKQGLTSDGVAYHIGELTLELSEMLYEQVRRCLRYGKQIPAEQNGSDQRCADCDHRAADVVLEFFNRLPAVREVLAADVEAAYKSDPAARGTDETIFCYPGLFAIFVQRVSHELFKLEVPLLPRVMTEYAHSRTGIDIHPGAKLGRSFFIDHGTGVVIGETCEIGSNVKIYQGVTLGALAPDRFVEEFRGRKRHPTIEDDVIIYSGATILGGETIIGRGAVIGGNVFITTSVPPHNRVTAEPPKLKYRARRTKTQPADEFVSDFQI